MAEVELVDNYTFGAPLRSAGRAESRPASQTADPGSDPSARTPARPLTGRTADVDKLERRIKTGELDLSDPAATAGWVDFRGQDVSRLARAQLSDGTGGRFVWSGEIVGDWELVEPLNGTVRLGPGAVVTGDIDVTNRIAGRLEVAGTIGSLLIHADGFVGAVHIEAGAVVEGDVDLWAGGRVGGDLVIDGRVDGDVSVLETAAVEHDLHLTRNGVVDGEVVRLGTIGGDYRPEGAIGEDEAPSG